MRGTVMHPVVLGATFLCATLVCPALLSAMQPEKQEILDISQDLQFHGVLGTETTLDVAFSPNGLTAATIARDGVTIWDVKTWETVKTLAIPSPGIRVDYSPDGKLLACAGPLAVHLWSTTDWSLVRKLVTGLFSSRDIGFSPDGSCFYAAGNHSVVRSWDAETWKPKKTTLRNVLVDAKGIKGTGAICFVAISPDGKLAATGGLTKATRLWRQGKKGRWKGVMVSPETPPRFAQGAQFSRDGRWLAIVGSGRLRMFDVEQGKFTHDIGLDPPEQRKGTLPVGVAFSADGSRVYTIGHRFQAWEVESGKRLEQSGLGTYVADKGGPSYIYGAQLLPSPDGTWMAVRLNDHPVRIYRIEKNL